MSGISSNGWSFSIRRGLGPPLLLLVGLALGGEILFRLAARARGPVTVDIGPSTGAYLSGFSGSEERPPTTFRWTGSHATIQLPLSADPGHATLSLRHQGHFRGPVPVHVFLGGREAGVFPVAAGPFSVSRLEVELPPGGLSMELLPEGPPDPGIAVDWIRIEGAVFRLPGSVWRPRALIVGAGLIALLAGFGLRAASGFGLSLALTAAAWAARDPFGFVHVTERITLPALALAAVSAYWLRRRPLGRFVALIFLLGYLLKGAMVFHPSYFYNDVRNNRRFVQALAGTEATLQERARAAQEKFGVAYPRVVGGKKYAFPYSPVFFLPFTFLPQDSLTIDEAMKHVVVALASADVLIVFWMAGLVFRPGAGPWAALIAAAAPVLYSRLLLGLWATLGGHFFDALMIAGALWTAVQPQSRLAFGLFAGAAQASLLTYVASLFNVTLFSTAWAGLERRRSGRILAVWAVGVLVTLLLLYRDFTALFIREILPAALQSPPDSFGASGSSGLLLALSRFRIFYGFGLSALAIAGFFIARRTAPRSTARVLTAYALSVIGLIVLRALPGGLFKDLKEIELACPLIALTAGISLDELASRGRSGRHAAALIAVGLLVFGLARDYEQAATWTVLAGL